jgi:hypothetical protein
MPDVGPLFNEIGAVLSALSSIGSVLGSQATGPSIGGMGGFRGGLPFEVIVQMLQLVGKEGPRFGENTSGRSSALMEF